jgi:O-methyltransferase involved in polyketide biosynthesis
MHLSDVSKTAIATLRSHVIESRGPRPIMHDPMAAYCLERLVSLASEEEKAVLFDRKLSSALTCHIAIRARKYDKLTDDFISRHPGCTVINLGCGFDTRYWRIDNTNCTYIELDLPEVIKLKKEILGERLCYELMGCSVLDPSWIDQVTSGGNKDFLLLAEGLLMYLPRDEVISLFSAMSGKFSQSQIVAEVVAEKYTRGLYRWLTILKIRQELGYDAGSYHFGIKNARELESYADGIKVIGEWSYFEDPDIRPRILRYLRLERSQWTVIATINA